MIDENLRPGDLVINEDRGAVCLVLHAGVPWVLFKAWIDDMYVTYTCCGSTTLQSGPILQLVLGVDRRAWKKELKLVPFT